MLLRTNGFYARPERLCTHESVWIKDSSAPVVLDAYAITTIADASHRPADLDAHETVVARHFGSLVRRFTYPAHAFCAAIARVSAWRPAEPHFLTSTASHRAVTASPHQLAARPLSPAVGHLGVLEPSSQRSPSSDMAQREVVGIVPQHVHETTKKQAPPRAIARAGGLSHWSPTS